MHQERSNKSYFKFYQSSKTLAVEKKILSNTCSNYKCAAKGNDLSTSTIDTHHLPTKETYIASTYMQ